MKKKIIIGIIICILVIACGARFILEQLDKKAASISIIGGSDGPTAIFVAGKLGGDNESENYGGEEMRSYISISMDEAREIFKTAGDYIIVDVRRADEFADGHIPGAINIANESIDNQMPEELSNLDQIIYVYCRSGNRSKQASEKLVKIGYTNIIEFGGIIDWKGDIEQ